MTKRRFGKETNFQTDTQVQTDTKVQTETHGQTDKNRQTDIKIDNMKKHMCDRNTTVESKTKNYKELEYFSFVKFTVIDHICDEKAKKTKTFLL